MKYAMTLVSSGMFAAAFAAVAAQEPPVDSLPVAAVPSQDLGINNTVTSSVAGSSGAIASATSANVNSAGSTIYETTSLTGSGTASATAGSNETMVTVSTLPSGSVTLAPNGTTVASITAIANPTGSDVTITQTVTECCSGTCTIQTVCPSLTSCHECILKTGYSTYTTTKTQQVVTMCSPVATYCPTDEPAPGNCPTQPPACESCKTVTAPGILVPTSAPKEESGSSSCKDGKCSEEGSESGATDAAQGAGSKNTVGAALAVLVGAAAVLL
ncbi:hypothetical protein TRVA0_017S01288 [Trichomonascus vanleenenianus]|uniref:uncharacterized protein n=1 Tax=Trichomonascus vanleenenianus TaxID=2268995 RepID=UPI003ECA5016